MTPDETSRRQAPVILRPNVRLPDDDLFAAEREHFLARLLESGCAEHV